MHSDSTSHSGLFLWCRIRKPGLFLQIPIVTAFLSIFMVPPTVVADESAGQNPNIIFILADDMGYGDVEALNPNCRIPTPNLNRMAGRGMLFTDAHTSSSVCTPTRYGLLTGRYNWRSPLKNGVTWGFSRRLIEPGRLTVAEVLRRQGYRTVCIGKWHLGMDWPLYSGGIADDGGRWDSGWRGGWAVDYSREVNNGPLSLGFDHFFGISASLDMPPYVYIRDNRPLVTGLTEKAFHRKGPADIDFEAVDVLPRLTYEAVRKINAWSGDSRDGRPFFIYLPLAAPHTPIVPTGEWEGRSGLNAYGDFVMQVDDSVGRIVQAVERNGLLENTLIIFTTDNGCSPAADLKGMEEQGHFANHPWRGHKADIFEGGHRVPFIVQWHGVVRSASRSERLTCLNDFMATCAELTGFALPPDAGEDSHSFLSELTGQESESTGSTNASTQGRAVVHHSINGSFAIRRGPWKLILCPDSGGWSAPRPGSGQADSLPPVQLYHLENDPQEKNNVFPSNRTMADDLYRLLLDYVDRGRSTPGPDSSNTGGVNVLAGVRGGKWPVSP